jgi:ParB-like chromosome segregation protein Spo0J
LIKQFKTEQISLDLIKFDETNPNEVTEEQMAGLKLAMQQFGYLVPIILNKDYTVIDGEHRVRAYRQLDQKKIPAIVIDIDSISLKELRQIMNKLKGQHNDFADGLEFKAIYDADRLDEFAKLMAKDKKEFEQLMEKQGLLTDDPEQEESEVEQISNFTINFKFKSEDDYENIVQTLSTIDTNKENALIKIISSYDN